MPTFEERVYVDIDISIEEFLDSCNDEELQEIREELDKKNITSNRLTGQDVEWNNEVSKLINSKYRLTTEEEELILNITNKLL